MDNAIQRINRYLAESDGKTYSVIHQIEVYPVDSVIRSSNNRDLEETFRNNTIVLTFSTKKQKTKKQKKQTNKQTKKRTMSVSGETAHLPIP